MPVAPRRVRVRSDSGTTLRVNFVKNPENIRAVSAAIALGFFPFTLFRVRMTPNGGIFTKGKFAVGG